MSDDMTIPAPPQRTEDSDSEEQQDAPQGLDRFIDIDVDEMYQTRNQPKLYAMGSLDGDRVYSGFDEDSLFQEDSGGFDDAIELEDI